MYKIVLALAATICTITLCSADAPKSRRPHHHEKDAPDKKLHTNCIYPTVKIVDEEASSGGSAVIVRSTKVGNKWHNLILTVNHNVEDEDVLFTEVPTYKNWSQIQSYARYRTVVYATNPKIDAAIAVFVSDKQMPTAKLRFDQPLYFNTKVFHVGYGLLQDARLDYGNVTQPSTRLPKMFAGTIRTNVCTVTGDSGGPLFNSDYEVIGYCRGVGGNGFAMVPNISFYHSVDAIKTWDAEANNALAPVYKESAPLPVLPFVKLKLQGYEYTLPE